MAFADQRLEPARPFDIGAVAAARTDWLDARRAQRVAILGPTQRAGSEHANIDDTHIGALRVGQEIAEIMRRIARRNLRSGAWIQQIVADLGGIEDARVDDAV